MFVYTDSARCNVNLAQYFVLEDTFNLNAVTVFTKYGSKRFAPNELLMVQVDFRRRYRGVNEDYIEYVGTCILSKDDKKVRLALVYDHVVDNVNYTVHEVVKKVQLVPDPRSTYWPEEIELVLGWHNG